MTLILNGTDNSATTPAVTGTDTDTGVYYPAANQVALATNGTLALIVDASRNIGLGATPSVSTLNGLVEGAYGNIGFTSALGVSIAGNAYYDSSWKYKVGSTATLHLQDSGGFKWFTAPSGSTGNAITFTQSLGLNKGTTLVLEGGASSSGTGIAFPATQSASTDANTLDDYEEGTWTPTFESDTPGAGRVTTVTYARYIKIGNQVFVEFTAQITTLGSGGSGVWVINGLPFASTNAGCMAIGAANTLATAFTSVGGITNGSRFIMRAQNGSAVSYIQNATFSTYVTTNTAITATCTYLV
jgi:hypothetical protein